MSEPKWPEKKECPEHDTDYWHGCLCCIEAESGNTMRDACIAAFNQWQSKRELSEEEVYESLKPLYLEGLWFPAEGVHRNGFFSDKLARAISQHIASHFSRPASISEEGVARCLHDYFQERLPEGERYDFIFEEWEPHAKAITAKFGSPGIDREKIAEIIYNDIAPMAYGGDNRYLEFRRDRIVVDCEKIANAIADHLEGRG